MLKLRVIIKIVRIAVRRKILMDKGLIIAHVAEKNLKQHVLLHNILLIINAKPALRRPHVMEQRQDVDSSIRDWNQMVLWRV